MVCADTLEGIKKRVFFGVTLSQWAAVNEPLITITMNVRFSQTHSIALKPLPCNLCTENIVWEVLFEMMRMKPTERLQIDIDLFY